MLRNAIIFGIILLIPVLVKPEGNEFASDKVYGVTLSSVTRLDETVEALSKLPKKPTARIVFDPWVYPDFYSNAIFRINKVSYIMGELLDSYSFSDYDLKFYKERVNAYLNYYPDKVDVWEIGNEVNGQWLGDPKKVAEKITSAFDLVEARKQKTAVTFYYYSEGCYEDGNYEMFNWIKKNIPDRMNTGLDYVFVSYYNDNCNTGDPDWDSIFERLHKIFPNAKLGIGECGTKDKDNGEDYMRKFYSINSSNPYFIGGYFWWYFKRDCVPYTKHLWSVLSELIANSSKKK